MSKIKIIGVFAVVVILMATVLVFASCKKTDEDTRLVNDNVENILIAMNNGNYEDFSKYLDDTIKAELSEDSFPEFVSAILGSNGNYEAGSKRLSSINIKADLITVSYDADFEVMKDVTVEVVFKDKGNEKKIISLWFLGPATNLFIGTGPNNS